ncbi:S8 family serine peptidase [uncultured Kordia sp.]|uniref:S8 family serine peptidase n=1 Tax=uncultured Kordia sp. TaxID=507699 RepID=UPI002601DC7C|nr:S8 family serine peptidase [uncultured Kordia sp.]
MKKVIVYCFALLLITTVGCQKESLNLEEADIAKETEITQKGGYANASNIQNNELIILYPDGTTEAEKILKRAEYDIQSHKKCECADPNLELWTIQERKGPNNDGGLEEKREAARSDEEIEGAEYNPEIKILDNVFVETGGIGFVNDAMQKQVILNQGVTIAVLDTGIDYNHTGFPEAFLYNSADTGCTDNGYDEIFGWNFVNENNNPYDDHYGRHGTIVASLIISELESANVDYQILPVKVANSGGNISYFDALCGFQYAANKPDVDIINMSFGWYHQERELLERFILEAPDKLVITSAGNEGLNNDEIPHYPSSYDSENILAIAALANHQVPGYNSNSYASGSFSNPSVGGISALADFSNRGVTSVDIAAPGEQIPFAYNNEIFYVDGTSYSAALTSGYSGSIHVDGMSGIVLKTAVIQNCIFSPYLDDLEHSSFLPLFDD